MKLVNQSTLDEMLESSKIPKCQSELVNEIFKAAGLKNPKSIKYSENWLLLCMLFQIKPRLFRSKLKNNKTY